MKQFFIKLIAGCAIFLLCVENSEARSNKDLLIETTLHFALSAEITFASCMFFTLKTPDISLTSKYLASAGIGLLAGMTKELTDLAMSDGYFDWVDIGVDVVGIGTGLLLHYCIFDRKMIKGNISFNLSDDQYLVSLKLSLK